MVTTRMIKHHSQENHGRREKTKLNMDVILHINNSIHSFIVLVTNLMKLGIAGVIENILPCKHLFPKQLYVFYNVGMLTYSRWLQVHDKSKCRKEKNYQSDIFMWDTVRDNVDLFLTGTECCVVSK